MIRCVLAAACAAWLALPASTEAQDPRTLFETAPRPGIRIGAFGGYLTGFLRSETWTVHAGDNVTTADADVQMADGPGGGVIVDVGVLGNLGITAAAGAFSRGETIFEVDESGDRWRLDGATVYMVRLGLSYQMPTDASESVLRRLDASVFASAVVLHDRLRNDLGTADLVGDATHRGLNIGMSGELPLGGNRFSLQAGIEDNIMFWRGEDLALLPWEFYDRPGTSPDVVRVRATPSHAWLLRLGVTARFR